MPSKPSRRDITHDRIVEVASRAIRRGGYDGVGVADIMKEAGLTHGGFYAHFASRNALLTEAVQRAGRDSAARIVKHIEARQAQGVSALRAVVENYLSDAHLAGTELGCPVAALCSEMPRQSPELLAASAERVRGLIAMVERALPPRGSKEQALAIVSTLVGALQLARTMGPNDQGRAILSAARKALIAQYDVG